MSLLLWACRAGAPGLAIYLLEQDVPGGLITGLDLDAAPLRQPPLFTLADVVSYAWVTHDIELTPEAYARVRGLFGPAIDVDGIPFVVCAGDVPVYAGAFWTPLSSLSFDGPTIMQPLDPDRRVVTISFGYPGEAFASGEDPRADPRVREALEKAGKLR